MIIEDEVAIADLEKDYLELSDFQVDICNAGDEGLDTALKGDYLYDGQPYTASSLRRIAGGIRAVKTFKDPAQILLSDPLAIVL